MRARRLGKPQAFMPPMSVCLRQQSPLEPRIRVNSLPGVGQASSRNPISAILCKTSGL